MLSTESTVSIVAASVLAILFTFICALGLKEFNILLSYNESIVLGEIFPVVGAAELQNLAQTYNEVYRENRETQSLLQHKAEHDPLTDLLNRGSFERILKIHEDGASPFAMILVEMTTELKYTIEDKIAAINEELSHPTDGLPGVSLSVGIAFTDRKNPGESIFKDADKALYYVKEHGKSGCAFYGENTESN